MTKSKNDVVRLVPAKRGANGRKKVPGKWVSISTKTGTVGFSSDLVNHYEWLLNCGRVALEYCKEKNEISIAQSDDGFKITERRSPSGYVQHTIIIRDFIGGDIFLDKDLIFMKNSERFEVKTLKKSFSVNLNKKKV